MGFKSIQSYQERIAKRRFKSPLKVAHIWIPMAFLMITIYRNQALTQLSLPEAAVGLGISALSFLPLFVWASKIEREVPAFQCFCAVHFPFYGYPIVHCKAEYIQHPEPDRLYAGITVLAFLAVANVVYYLGMSRLSKRGPGKALAYRELPEKTAQTLFTLLLAGWALFMVLKHFGFLPFLGTFSNTVTSFACGGGIVGLWILSRQIGEGKLSSAHRAFVLCLIFVGLAVSFATATLIGGFVMLIVGVVGYSLTCRKLPWMTIIFSISLMSFLNLGKGEMRRMYWSRGVQSNNLTISKTIEIYKAWIPASCSALWYGKDRHGNKAQHLLDRANLIHIQALVVGDTPSRLPYLWGETYKYMVTGLVPRFIWKDKPHGHMASTILGLHYRVTDAGALKTTTVGFGYLPESWANFGWLGVIGLAILMGTAMQSVARACHGASPYSLHSLLSVVWVAWSFQVELPLSTWFTSFSQAIIAILTLCYLFSCRAAPVAVNNLGYSTA